MKKLELLLGEYGRHEFLIFHTNKSINMHIKKCLVIMKFR